MKNKVISRASLPAVTKKLRAQRKKIGFTNGTFDILHLGHVTYLQKARTCCDVLIVAVNSDASVKSYKTPDRPINPEKDRMAVLAALECVDYVVLFTEPTPLNLIIAAKPDVLIKGADWKKSQIAGAAEVESWGGKVKLIPLVAGKSTTSIIQKMRSGTSAA
jgi:rfaE bifunctional protein nucleotidyltransferase chain/domain